MSLPQSDRVITVVNGEVPAAAPGRPRRTSLSWTTSTTTWRRIRAGWTVRDPALAARLACGTGTLLITCRHPFSLGETPQARLTFRRLGPLTLSGAAELTTSLPAIRLLGDAERDQRWRLTAGHPLAMEYLNLSWPAAIDTGPGQAHRGCDHGRTGIARNQPTSSPTRPPSGAHRRP